MCHEPPPTRHTRGKQCFTMLSSLVFAIPYHIIDQRKLDTVERTGFLRPFSPFSFADSAIINSLDRKGGMSQLSCMKAIATAKGQITIPKPIRDKLGIVPGTVLEVESGKGMLIAKKKQALDLFTRWRGKGKLPFGKAVDEYISGIRDDSWA